MQFTPAIQPLLSGWFPIQNRERHKGHSVHHFAEIGQRSRTVGQGRGDDDPPIGWDVVLTKRAKVAACKRMRARLFDVIVWSRNGAASDNANRALRLATTSMLLAGRLRGPMARRSKRSIASRRLRVEAVESIASLPKHSTKPGRTPPFICASDSTVMARAAGKKNPLHETRF
jgi:hypothetical protein